jgi:hypothetical protein
MNQNQQKKEFQNIFFEILFLYIIIFFLQITFEFELRHLFKVNHMKDNIFWLFKNLDFVYRDLNKKL